MFPCTVDPVYYLSSGSFELRPVLSVYKEMGYFPHLYETDSWIVAPNESTVYTQQQAGLVQSTRDLHLVTNLRLRTHSSESQHSDGVNTANMQLESAHISYA